MLDSFNPGVVEGGYNRAHHMFAVFTACATFLLIVAGALVTSNDAGLSVPDWPTSFGSIYRMPPMIGGVRFEHGHRMLAESVGFLTIALAVWTWRIDKRRWMRLLSIGALAVVIAQGLLGGLTVLFFLPPAISTAHAALAQTFFSIAIVIALYTSRTRVTRQLKRSSDVIDQRLTRLAAMAVVALYVQLILGAMFRHRGLSWWPHVANSVVVVAVLAWTAVRSRDVEQVRRPALLVFILMIVQVFLGCAALFARIVHGSENLQPQTIMVVSTVAHVAVGALLLATAVVLAISAWTERVGSGRAYSSSRPVANSAVEISRATGRAGLWVPTVENGR
jgi:heme a synthase